jgi:hypothetical protein
MITENPWNNECELCYGKHPFKEGDVMFQVIPTGLCDEPIIICQICLFRNKWEAIDKQKFPLKKKDE